MILDQPGSDVTYPGNSGGKSVWSVLPGTEEQTLLPCPAPPCPVQPWPALKLMNSGYIGTNDLSSAT